MKIQTRVDGDLLDYYESLESKPQIEDEDVQKLLDAYRVKFGLDLVFISEMLIDENVAVLTHVSAAGGRSYVGNKYHSGLGSGEYRIVYDEAGLCSLSDKKIFSDREHSVLLYGIFRNGEYDGCVGILDFHEGRKWTEEEQAAVQKLGRVLKCVLYVERTKKINAADKETISSQNRALQTFFSTTDCGLIRHTVNGARVLSINKAALKILGYESQEELVAEGFDLIAASVAEEDREKLRECIGRLKAAGDSTSVAYRVRHRDGEVLEVMGGIKLLEENGELIYQRFLLDCTAQKLQEKKERVERERLHIELIRALSMDYGSVYFVNLDTEMAVPHRINDDINRRFGSIFTGEIPLGESMELYIRQVVYASDRELFRQAASAEKLKQELAEKISYHFNYRTFRNGVTEYFQMKAVRMGEWDKSHNIVIGFRSVDEEIRNEMKQKKLIEDSYGIIAGLSSDYNFIALVNSKSGKLSVYKAADSSYEVTDALANKSLYADAVWAYSGFVSEEDRERWLADTRLENILKQLEDKQKYNVNIKTYFQGRNDYIQFSFTRVSGYGNQHQLVLAKRNITEIVEKEIKQRMLLEDALAQAERANRAKSTFLSNMSHDIRTPMNAIIGYTTLATTHIDQKERVREYLGKIMASGNHLLSLINDVLDMSRIESGKIHIEEKPCSLPDILHELRNILQADIHAKQLELCIDTVDVINEEIYCDRLRLNQVLLNLLGNAVKFTAAGGRISVRIIEKTGAPAGYANYVFHIRDNGIGMSEEFISHIFEPFERERNSTISGIQGTGLGMAITKNIVDMMNGTIQVKSEQGVGTEFTVFFTFRLQSEAKEPQTIAELEGARALIVDDDFNTCDSVSGMLQQIGMRAEWTLSGKEAVLRTRQALAREDAYGVYIIDWLMPDMNGIEVTRRIRAEVGEDVPVIVLTAYDWSDIEAEAKEAGVTAFCSKPLFLSELRQCLQTVIRPEAAQKDGGKEPVKKRSGRILLAEDNEINREIAVELLSGAGFIVETAENGQIAVDMLSASEPGYYQLVLMDIQMPVMNGYDATIAIRKLEDRALASVPILAMTANAFEEDRKAALACGMNGHMAKPIDIRNMFGLLDEVLGDQQ